MEFKIYDKINKEFIEDYHADSFTMMDFKRIEEFDFCDYIGKKDINSKKIYADCSIVEFKDHKLDVFIGYFTYNVNKLAYEIKVLNYVIDSDFMPIITFCKDDISNIKIIDTIQENKLSLIKNK